MPKIKPHETWNIVDSSKLTTFMRCPRKYFWKYILGMSPEVKSIHLSFGAALHDAFEVLLLNKDEENQQDRILMAQAKFYDSISNEVSEDELDLHPNKNRNNAEKAIVLLDEVIQAKQPFKVLHTEVHGETIIDEKGNTMTFRIDALIEDKDGIKVVDLKTASRLGKQWTMQWELSIQMGLYAHAAKSYYDDIWGVEVWGIGLYKSKDPEFLKAVVKTPNQYADSWLFTTQYWFDLLKDHHYVLKQDEAEGRLRRSFPMNPNACTDYGGCIYHDLCSVWNNPLEHIGEMPAGFVESWWNPTEV